MSVLLSSSTVARAGSLLSALHPCRTCGHPKEAHVAHPEEDPGFDCDFATQLCLFDGCLCVCFTPEPFKVLCADPPWKFGDSLPGKTRGASKQYECLSLEELAVFSLPPIADDALLFLWRVSSMVPEAYALVEAWGFDHKTEIVWSKKTTNDKQHFGMGRIVRASHETCIVAKRGRPEIRSRSIRSLFETEASFVFEAQTGVHSEKPEIFYTDIVEKLSAGPYVELFSRRRRAGWTNLGNQVPAEIEESV